MSNVISVNKIGKAYTIGHQMGRNNSIRDGITDYVKNFLNKDKKWQNEEFWALKDVSFEVSQGDRIGIMGRNGAGKSTLLKVLSRITHPTTGYFGVKGKVVSLLEVGTGFHPELSGRENIYLNGAILGMSKADIDRRFDEIVEFSEVEKFLDTPVKRYSSGMYVRLAFSVAAHLEAEIMIVDEVLAVGDVQFQQKCLGKMSEVGKNGRTVLFVSHNIGAISGLCNRGLFLKQGQTQGICDLSDAVSHYLGDITKNSTVFENEIVKWARVEQNDDKLEIEVKFESDRVIAYPNLGFIVYDLFGGCVYGSNFIACPPKNIVIPRKSGTIKAVINQPKLLDGSYRLSLYLSEGNVDIFQAKDCLKFDVAGMVKTKQWPTQDVGYVSPVIDWEINDQTVEE